VTSRRHLIVMRHAKAEPFAASDHARELTDRGLRDARDAGRYLADTGRVPDHAVVSTAARTQGTWRAVMESSGSSAEAVLDSVVYSGSADMVLESLRVVPAEARIVLFVGHNPTAAYVAHLLEDGNGEASVLEQMLAGYPTSAMAVFEPSVPWEQLGPETCRLVDFYVGRG
jgi:phosphohistidine phosphatase